MKKKILNIALSLSVILLFSPLSIIYADNADFEGNEGYYYELCSDPIRSKENRSTCESFNDYLRTKSSNAQSELDKLQYDIDEIRANIMEEAQKIDAYEAEIEEGNARIAEMDSAIISLQSNIQDLESSILNREVEIQEKDDVIVERMKKDQSELYFGNELDFLMGAEDFATLLNSVGILKDILNYEDQQIKEIEEIIEIQNEEKESLAIQEETLEISKQDAKNEQDIIKEKKAKVEVIYQEFNKQEAQLMELHTQSSINIDAIQSQIASVGDALKVVETSTGGFRRPIDGGYLSAGVWNYPAAFGGGIHLGNDYAAGIGTPIYAAGNGYVLMSGDGCPTIGGLGNQCGGPVGLGGNQVVLIVSVDGLVYQIAYFHMQSGTPIGAGNIVNRGDMIGRVGSSGNSSGAHVHTEMIYLGPGTVNEYVQSFYSYDWGTGWGLGRICENTGHGAPCRLNPSEVFN